MAKNEGALRQISVQDGSVTVTLGPVQATVPGPQLDSFIRALEAARLMLQVEVAEGGAVASAPAAVAPKAEVARRGYTTYEPKAEAVVEAAAPKRRGGRPKGSGKTPVRKSRKRVGDALVDWLRSNPGWHSTEELLSVVSSHKMTDASPKRALMIALGKQKDTVFVTDGQENWKLADDPSAEAAAAAPKERKKPGRKPGAQKAQAKAPAKTAAKAKAKVTEKPARAKRQAGKSRGRPPKSAAADKEGSSLPQAEITPGRLVRVKKGQDRKEALLTPQELELRKQAATAVDTMHFRWDVASRAERERMRRNLFGDGAPGKIN